MVNYCHFSLSHRCMFRVLDSFGTYVEFNFPGYRFDVAVLWGHQDLIPTQFMTLYRKCSGISWSKYSMISCYKVMLTCLLNSLHSFHQYCVDLKTQVFLGISGPSKSILYSLVYFQTDMTRN